MSLRLQKELYTTLFRNKKISLKRNYEKLRVISDFESSFTYIFLGDVPVVEVDLEEATNDDVTDDEHVDAGKDVV